MAKTKITQKALLMSALSILLGVSMLVGTTFAWFTDSVTSANNIITSGNLDVDMEYLDSNGAWQPLDENTNVFMENVGWEPGHTEVVYLKVLNAGSLAFNYKLGVSIVEETSSTNVNDEVLKLSDYIVMGAVEDVTVAYADRESARNAVDESNVAAINRGYAQEGVLYPVGNMPSNIQDASSEKYVALVVYMPETVGNEANYKKGADVPTIKLGINLLATQATYEEDSFNNQYDANANTSTPPVPSEDTTIDFTVYDVFDANKPAQDIEDVNLKIYNFVATNFEDSYPLAEYKDWTCDFFVSTDSPVDEGLILVGNYSTFGWLGFWVPENDVAYDPVGLLGVVTSNGESNWTYQGIHEDVQIFRCGLIDYESNNDGVKVTVELRMTSPDKSQTITVTSITVTLGE